MNKATAALTPARLPADPKFSVGHLLTHRFGVDDYRAAVKTFMSKRESHAIKIVLEHST